MKKYNYWSCDACLKQDIEDGIDENNYSEPCVLRMGAFGPEINLCIIDGDKDADWIKTTEKACNL